MTILTFLLVYHATVRTYAELVVQVYLYVSPLFWEGTTKT